MSRALRTLTSSANPVPVTFDNFQQVKKLLPYNPPPPHFPFHAYLNPINKPTFLRYLENMSKRHRSPGLSKTTPKHLLNLCKLGDHVTLPFVNLANYLLAGQGDSLPHSKILKVSKLALLPKPKGGLRPIGINEFFLNLCSTYALDQVTPKIMQALHPMDFGFNRPAGAEAATHCLRLATEDHQTNGRRYFILNLDFENAFNSLDREMLLRDISVTCPELLPYYQFRYSDAKFKFASQVGTDMRDCTTGVIQGDPLSPATFQLAVSYALRRPRTTFGVPIMSFLDDIAALTLDLQTASGVIRAIRTEFKKYGLELNLRKSSIYSNQPITQAELMTFSFLRDITIVDSMKGIEMLGAKVGTQDFINTSLNEELVEFDRLCSVFQGFSHYIQELPFTERPKFWKRKMVQFIRWSLASRSVYRLRTTHPSLTEAFAYKYDQRLASCLLRCLLADRSLQDAPPDLSDLLTWLHYNRNDDQSDPSAICFSRIFLRRGGAGIYSARLAATPAYLGSIASSMAHLKTFYNMYLPGSQKIHLSLGIAPAVIRLRRTGVQSSIKEVFTSPFKLQHVLYQRNMRTNMHRTADQIAKRTPKELAKFCSRAHQFSNAFLHKSIFDHHDDLPNEAFEDNFLLSIGLSPYFERPDCTACGNPIGTSLEDHGTGRCAAHIWRSFGKILEDGVRNVTRILDESPNTREVILENITGWVPKNQNGPRRRGDILTDHGGESKVIDVTGTSKFKNLVTWFRRNFNLKGNFITTRKMRDIAPQAGFSEDMTILDYLIWLAGTEKENFKINRYGTEYYFPAHHLVIASLDTHGGVGPHFVRYLLQAKKAHKQTHPWLYGTHERTPFRKAVECLSLSICRANYFLFKRVRGGNFQV